MPSAQELVKSCSTVFTLPEIYFRVRAVVENHDSTMEDLAKVLKIDPAISARLLRIVNSPFYGFPKQIDTISRAVNLIGMQAVSDLVTATTIGRTFSGMTTDLMDLSAYWRKSVLCALMAAKIAKSCGIEDSERFFIEGLLRDIGHLILYQAIPKQAQAALVEANNLGSPLAEIEQASIGADYAEVGAELIRSWEMPLQMESAIRHQLKPSDAGEFTLHASIVHLAGVLADHADLDPAKLKQALPFHAYALSTTRFKPEESPALIEASHSQLHETLELIYPLALAA
ncbi:MAG: HDOD domain-containing protein [Nitrospira sp.]|jgi:HD-like signal output (HDOD) protein|nr:HDOD domain-containing protein [Nitrospira sp.]